MASVIHTGNATMSNTSADREPGTVWTALTILLGAGAIYLALSLLVGYAAQGTRFGSATAQVWQSLVSAPATEFCRFQATSSFRRSA